MTYIKMLKERSSREGENLFKEILKNEQKELEERIGVKISVKLLCKLGKLDYQKIIHPERYSDEAMGRAVKELKRKNFSKLIRF